MKHGFQNLVKTSIVTSLLLLMCAFAFSQTADRSDTLYVSIKLLDKQTLEKIAYATVFNRRTGKGTITNLEGDFALANLNHGDTLQISFVGYNPGNLILTQSLTNTLFYLDRKTELLNEVIISADNSYLYDMIIACQKSKYKNTQQAKTYFMLASEIDGKQTELVECYYNGTYTGYDTEDLNLKNGRIALAPFNNQFFISTESSKSIIQHKLFSRNANFPASPFQFNLAKLKRNYELRLVSTYLNDHEKIYVIDFSPADTSRSFFEGRVWINAGRSQIVKVTLEATNTHMYPFTPIWPLDSLLQVDLQITKTYQNTEKEVQLNSIDFNYKLHYKQTDSSNANDYLVNTNCVLFPYDYADLFVLPQFDFPNRGYADYRRINAVPYNDFFWDSIDEFKMKDITNKSESFIHNHATLSKREIFEPNVFSQRGLFEYSYAFWGKDRLHFRADLGKDTPLQTAKVGTIPAEQYHLEAQIYLDVNAFNDSINVLTESIFDPFKSYYHIPITEEGRAFINMYFDMVEIQRRKLVKRLDGIESIDEIMAIYAESKTELEATSRTFLKDLNHGTNREGLEKWIKIILDNLEVDNYELFNLVKVSGDVIEVKPE